MNSKVSLARTAAMAAILAMSPAISLSASAHASKASAIDTNGDGSISLDEAHAAAAKKFERLDKKHTGKLTAKQVSPISRAMSEMARHDKDHTIDQDEYMSGVDAAFKEADPKGSGVLNAKALKTKAGKRFLALVE